MALKTNIIRITLLALWIVLGSAVLVLLVAAINIKSHKSCKGIDIEIMGVKEIFFLDKNDIMKIVSNEGIDRPAGMAITSFDLRKLETVLERNVWVKDAELFFDNNLLLHINILEKEPVARVFATNGSSFYIDSSGSMMPLNNKMNVKLPVFTGFPDDKKQKQSGDSLLLRQIRNITMYILDNKFWLAQVAQIDIDADRNFSIVPTVGNHIIEFGNGDNYESKFRRLLTFYKKVLGNAGIDTYSKISVEYDKQVIGTRKGFTTKIDSVQALKNIQKMIEDAKNISEDSVFAPLDKNSSLSISRDSMIMDIRIDSGNEVPKAALKPNDVVKPQVVRSKPSTEIKPVKKQEVKQMPDKPVIKKDVKPVEKPKPKALMGKINH